MDWGNAILGGKGVRTGDTVISMTAELNLAGDFKKTKKVTWLADPEVSGHALVNVRLLDYDYLITKKKLEETDEVGDYVTRETEFCVSAWADAGVRELREGDVMQFERKGYYRVDKVDEEEMVFVRIPDGKAAGVASKSSGVASASASASGAGAGTEAGAETGTEAGGMPVPEVGIGETVMLSNGSEGFEIPVRTGMYRVGRVYGEEAVIPKNDTNMYQVL